MSLKVVLSFVVAVVILILVIGIQVKSKELQELDKLWFSDQEEIYLLLSGASIPNCTPIKFFTCGEYPFPNNFIYLPRNCKILNSRASVVNNTLVASESCTSKGSPELTKLVKEYSEIYWKNRDSLEKEFPVLTLIEVLENGMSNERGEVLKQYIKKLIAVEYTLLWKDMDYTELNTTNVFFKDPTGQRAERFYNYWEKTLLSCPEELKQACALTRIELLGDTIPYNESAMLKECVELSKRYNITLFCKINMEYINEQEYGIKFKAYAGIGKKYYEKTEHIVHVLERPYTVYIHPDGTAEITPI